jgi:para-nitrobenzyl esterase
VPTILGTNRDENKLFLLFVSPHVRRLFGLPLWLIDGDAYDLSAEYQSKSWKAAGVDEPAAAMRKARSAPVFAYRFDWDEEPTVLWADFSRMLGAAHALEIPFVFGTLDLGRGNRFLWNEEKIPARDALSDAMMSYWTQFAYTGDPGRGRDGSLETWAAWDPSSASAPKFMVFDTPEDGGLRMSSDTVDSDQLVARLATDERFSSEQERCEIFLQFVQWRELVSEAEYARACPDFPMDEHPWSE